MMKTNINKTSQLLRENIFTTSVITALHLLHNHFGLKLSAPGPFLDELFSAFIGEDGDEGDMGQMCVWGGSHLNHHRTGGWRSQQRQDSHSSFFF